MIGGQSSFPDYASHLSSINGENFWPSFTDIMMVVVIVFLLSSTVAVLHNWDLSRQVQETAALEQQARERAEDLNLRRMLLQLELEEMQGRMGKTREALEAKTGQLEQREEDLAGAQDALAEQQIQLMEMQEEYARVQTEMRMSQDVSAEREQELLDVQQQLEKMRDESVLREQMYVEVEKQQRQTREELALLQEEYEEMGQKYTALSKPARSSMGKVVTAVRYMKVEGQPLFLFKLPGAQQFEPIGEEEMHQALSRLKEEHGNKLFVRIVIPMDSNLTYQEGWEFSLDLLRRYDYYYAD